MKNLIRKAIRDAAREKQYQRRRAHPMPVSRAKKVDGKVGDVNPRNATQIPTGKVEQDDGPLQVDALNAAKRLRRICVHPVR